jgi:YgiT-type zinc finger domain-containing protein
MNSKTLKDKQGKYADCYYCGGAGEEKIQTHKSHREQQLILVENVPMGVCNQCGERYTLPEVAGRIDKIAQEMKPAKTVEIPVYTFEQKVA